MTNQPSPQPQSSGLDDADVFIFNGGIEYQTVDKLLTGIRQLPSKKSNIALILTTNGGSADAAYRLVRFLKAHYSRFSLYVFSMCKSAGSLIALGADEIIMSDFGELGPLDVQLRKEDDFNRTSGLSYYSSLVMLGAQVYNMFESHFLNLKGRSDGIITTKTAGDLATHLATGILAPIASHIDPVRLGEVDRAIKISIEYGNRICGKEEVVRKLTVEYPSHEFVIDFEEASGILGNVRKPTDREFKLELALFDKIRVPLDSKEALIQYLNIATTHGQQENNTVSFNGESPEGHSEDIGDSEAVKPNPKTTPDGEKEGKSSDEPSSATTGDNPPIAE